MVMCLRIENFFFFSLVLCPSPKLKREREALCSGHSGLVQLRMTRDTT